MLALAHKSWWQLHLNENYFFPKISRFFFAGRVQTTSARFKHHKSAHFFFFETHHNIGEIWRSLCTTTRLGVWKFERCDPQFQLSKLLPCFYNHGLIFLSIWNEKVNTSQVTQQYYSFACVVSPVDSWNHRKIPTTHPNVSRQSFFITKENTNCTNWHAQFILWKSQDHRDQSVGYVSPAFLSLFSCRPPRFSILPPNGVFSPHLFQPRFWLMVLDPRPSTMKPSDSKYRSGMSFFRSPLFKKWNISTRVLVNFKKLIIFFSTTF